MEQKYTITIETVEDGRRRLTRRNDGFDPIELIGLLEMAQLEILQQIRGRRAAEFPFEY